MAAWEHTEESLTRQRERAEEAADEFNLATDTLNAGGDPDVLFPPQVGRQCAWCDFRRSCPEGQAAGPQAEPWALLARADEVKG